MKGFNKLEYCWMLGKNWFDINKIVCYYGNNCKFDVWIYFFVLLIIKFFFKKVWIICFKNDKMLWYFFFLKFYFMLKVIYWVLI